MSPACPVRLNLGNADCPALPVEGIGLDLIHAAAHIPVAFCCDPEAEADLRCGLAAVFLAGASLNFLPSIAPSARSRPCGDLPIAYSRRASVPSFG